MSHERVVRCDLCRDEIIGTPEYRRETVTFNKSVSGRLGRREVTRVYHPFNCLEKRQQEQQAAVKAKKDARHREIVEAALADGMTQDEARALADKYAR